MTVPDPGSAAAARARRSCPGTCAPPRTRPCGATDVVTELALAREEWRENEAVCAWCQVATAVSVASLAIAVAEGRRAWRQVRGG